MSNRRVIFPDPDIWTRKEHTIPAPIPQPLTDDERDLLGYLTVWVIAQQTRVSLNEAARALEELNEQHGLYRTGDNTDAYVSCNGHVILHVTREWLAYWAHTDEELTTELLLRNVNHYRGDER